MSYMDLEVCKFNTAQPPSFEANDNLLEIYRRLPYHSGGLTIQRSKMLRGNRHRSKGQRS